MKHIFIINPNAGMVDRSAELLDRIKTYFDAISTEYYVFVTEGPGHATEVVSTMCGFSSMEELRFYSCGGDGTLFEVINGIADFTHTEVAMLPTGKCNDVLTIFGAKAASFGSLRHLVQGKPLALDAMRVNDAYYALNKVCLGLDAQIAEKVNKKFYVYLRSLSPLLTAMALTFKSCFHLCDHEYVVTLDGQAKPLSMHFAVVMNAYRHYARFFQIRDSSINTGDLKAITIKSVYDISCIAQFLDCEVGKFPKSDAEVSIYEAKSFEVRRKDAGRILLSMDGETVPADFANVSVCPHLINFVIPSDLRGEF